MTTEHKDPFAIHVEEMIEQYEPHEIHTALVAAVNKAPVFDPSTSPADASLVQRLDLYLEQWTLTTLLRQKDTEGLGEMQRLVDVSITLLEIVDLQQTYPMLRRWEGFEALLEGKRLQLNPDDQLVDDAFVDTTTAIINMIKPVDIRQEELADKLGVSIRRIKTIVGVMEDRQQLIRYRDKGVTWVGKNYT